MLCLKRRTGERIVLMTSDGRVTVQVYDIDRGTVKLGIDAPQAVKILREELLPPIVTKGGG